MWRDRSPSRVATAPRRRPRSAGPAAIHPARLSAREALLFEAGIKLGGLFHQYLGVPVSDATAAGLARTIERAVALQPYVVRIRVRIVPRRGGRTGTGRFAYRYLTPTMLDATVTLSDGTVAVEARLAHSAALRYPLMRVERVRAGRRA
jgi:dihydroneopterin aldolase